MVNQSTKYSQLFSSLIGRWVGEGNGGYPTIPSFHYRETLSITRRDEKSLGYEQRTQKCYVGQTDWLISHWENGFIRALENGELEMVNAQSGGRSEVLVGAVEVHDNLFTIHFKSKVITNDPRVTCTGRILELEEGILRYQVECKQPQ